MISAAVYADIVVIAHKEMENLDFSQIGQIYLSKLKIVSGGQFVIPIDHAPFQPIYEEFYTKVIQMTPLQLKAYRSKRKFMEKDSGFKVIEEDRDIVAEVAKTPGALGYIRVKPINENIRVLLVIP